MITIMVTFTIVSEYSLTSPSNGGGEKISGGPLYDLDRVKTIIQDGKGLQPVSYTHLTLPTNREV